MCWPHVEILGTLLFLCKRRSDSHKHHYGRNDCDKLFYEEISLLALLYLLFPNLQNIYLYTQYRITNNHGKRVSLNHAMMLPESRGDIG